MVKFRGEVTTLSQAALIAIREMGYDWPAARGAEYWTLEGVKLVDMAPIELNFESWTEGGG